MANENDPNLFKNSTTAPHALSDSNSKPWWLFWVGLALIALIPIMRNRSMHSKLLGNRAPDLVFHSLDGQRMSLLSFSGNTVLLNFWASWCGPCMGEMPSLKELEAKLSDKKFIILAVNIDESSSSIQPLIKRGSLPKNLFFEPLAETLEAFQVHSIPVSFLIDENGMLKKSYIGPRDWISVSVLREIESVIPN